MDERKEQNEDLQKSYYNAIAREYDEHYSSDAAIAYREMIYAEFLTPGELAGKEVLDAMCGGGQNSIIFSRMGARITALDLSDAQCELYRKRFPGNRIICASVLESGLPDESFDFIYVDSLHHLHPRVNDAIKEFHRLLKPGGRLMLWEPSGGSALDLFRRLWYRLDTKYFQENEAAIDLERLRRAHPEIRLLKHRYGGNIGYVLVFLSMALRIPSRWVNFYSKPLLKVEMILQKVQGRFLSLWFISLFEK
jgi:ubiquinone/menaquinone biosynthesis C-methylase UbiE